MNKEEILFIIKGYFWYKILSLKIIEYLRIDNSNFGGRAWWKIFRVEQTLSPLMVVVKGTAQKSEDWF